MSFTLFASRKSEINNAIASIQSQIAILQQQLADQQAFLQEIGTVEQAGESALNQARTFLSMVRAIDPSQEAVFRQAMDALYSTDVELLAPSNDPQPESEPTPSPSPDGGSPTEEDGIETVEATAVPVTDDTAVAEATETVEEEKQEEDKPNVVSHEAPAGTLHKQPAKTLQWLAAKRGIDTVNMKRHQMASALTGLVTHAELKEAIAQGTKAV